MATTAISSLVFVVVGQNKVPTAEWESRLIVAQ